jgi:hypothetical protein
VAAAGIRLRPHRMAMMTRTTKGWSGFLSVLRFGTVNSMRGQGAATYFCKYLTTASVREWTWSFL